MKRNDGTGFPERDGNAWKLFRPAAWVLVRIPYLRMALSTEGYNFARDRLQETLRKKKEAR